MCDRTLLAICTSWHRNPDSFRSGCGENLNIIVMLGTDRFLAAWAHLRKLRQILCSCGHSHARHLVLVPFIAGVAFMPCHLMSETGAMVTHIACDYWRGCYYHVSPSSWRPSRELTSFGMDLASITLGIGTHHKILFHTQGTSREDTIVTRKCLFVRPEFDFMIVQGL
jgi:hypothetical protein